MADELPQKATEQPDQPTGEEEIFIHDFADEIAAIEAALIENDEYNSFIQTAGTYANLDNQGRIEYLERLILFLTKSSHLVGEAFPDIQSKNDLLNKSEDVIDFYRRYPDYYPSITPSTEPAKSEPVSELPISTEKAAELLQLFDNYMQDITKVLKDLAYDEDIEQTLGKRGYAAAADIWTGRENFKDAPRGMQIEFIDSLERYATAHFRSLEVTILERLIDDIVINKFQQYIKDENLDLSPDREGFMKLPETEQIQILESLGRPYNEYSDRLDKTVKEELNDVANSYKPKMSGSLHNLGMKEISPTKADGGTFAYFVRPAHLLKRYLETVNSPEKTQAVQILENYVDKVTDLLSKYEKSLSPSLLRAVTSEKSIFTGAPSEHQKYFLLLLLDSLDLYVTLPPEALQELNGLVKALGSSTDSNILAGLAEIDPNYEEKGLFQDFRRPLLFLLTEHLGRTDRRDKWKTY